MFETFWVLWNIDCLDFVTKDSVYFQDEIMSEDNRAGDCFDWRDDAVPSLLTLRGLSSFP